MGSNYSRIIANIFLLTGVFVLPWWFFIVLASVLFFWFSPFYEGLAMGLAVDLLYSVPREIFWNLPVFFIFFIIVFLSCGMIWQQFRIRN